MNQQPPTDTEMRRAGRKLKKLQVAAHGLSQSYTLDRFRVKVPLFNHWSQATKGQYWKLMRVQWLGVNLNPTSPWSKPHSGRKCNMHTNEDTCPFTHTHTHISSVSVGGGTSKAERFSHILSIACVPSSPESINYLRRTDRQRGRQAGGRGKGSVQSLMSPLLANDFSVTVGMSHFS